MVDLLIRAGAEVNTTPNEITPLHRACIGSNSKILCQIFCLFFELEINEYSNMNNPLFL